VDRVAGAVVGDTAGRGRRLPADAERLRIPLHQRSQQRMTTRWGFTIDAADAVQRARSLVQEEADNAERLVLLASVLTSRGDDTTAMDAARRALDLAPGSASAHTTMSAIEGRRGDIASALTHASQAVTLDPDDPAAVYNRGALLWMTGDHRAAREDFAGAGHLLGIEPGVPRWQVWRRRR
jgi:Flp pilus assembly protein TadD